MIDYDLFFLSYGQGTQFFINKKIYFHLAAYLYIGNLTFPPERTETEDFEKWIVE